MIELLENLTQITTYCLFNLIPAIVAIPFGELGKSLIEMDAFRYGVGIVALVVFTGAYKPILKRIGQ